MWHSESLTCEANFKREDLAALTCNLLQAVSGWAAQELGTAAGPFQVYPESVNKDHRVPYVFGATLSARASVHTCVIPCPPSTVLK